ncbi:hypothetical protein CWATWH0402_6200 [Crocosphaera watsonii WH 0402]|uniref:Uncharacterized protein n=1 Tax=Crocosphaera watsonii WH 0402 TaxID=1284629 RepID=T2JRT3_CROWT|nr:hypothetical protein CWATWH0402_6200 [Crocosphaera watsonii WH 0402]
MLLTINNALPVVVTKTQPQPTAQSQQLDQHIVDQPSQPNPSNQVNSSENIPF